WLQRLSSLLFGTRPGRWLTLFVLLPFGGAFATLVFAQEILHLARVHVHLAPAAAWGTVGVLGVFLLLLLHAARFPARVGAGLTVGWEGARKVVHDWPAAFLSRPAVRRVLDSRPVVVFRRFVLRPLVLAGAAAVVCVFAAAEGTVTGAVSAGVFLVALGF